MNNALLTKLVEKSIKSQFQRSYENVDQFEEPDETTHDMATTRMLADHRTLRFINRSSNVRSTAVSLTAARFARELQYGFKSRDQGP